MRIGIYGCGAMGTVLGAFLSRGGLDVELIDIYEAHVKALNEKGAKVIGHEDFTAKVKAIMPTQMTGVYDLVIVLCKQTANPAAFKAIAPFMNDGSTICTLQNGVPEPGVAEFFGKDRVVGGTIFWGATFSGPGVSEVTEPLSAKKCLFEIGTISGEASARANVVKEALSIMGPTMVTANLMGARWDKLIFNSAMSGVSSAMYCAFAGVLDSPEAMRLIGEIGYEAGLVSKAAGVTLAPYGGLPMNVMMRLGPLTKPLFRFGVRSGYKNMRAAKASMLQDLEKGLKTEVDMINGYICAQGRKHGIPTPVNDKVVEIICGIESGKLPKSPSNIRLFGA